MELCKRCIRRCLLQHCATTSWPSSLLLLLFVLLRPTLAAVRPGCSQELLRRYPSGWPVSLDWGIYWFGPNGAFEKAALEGEQATSRYYSHARRTLLFFHGWMGSAGGAVQNCYRETTFCDKDLCADTRPTFEAWIEAGWNVGFFYWDQFSDEPCSRDAEMKIWTNNTDLGLRWASAGLDSEKRYHEFRGIAASVSELCADGVEDALREFKGPQLLLVGHSLGAQLATRCAAMLRSRQKVIPTRLTLLDPFFTKRHFGGFFRCHAFRFPWAGGHYGFVEAAAKHVQELFELGTPTDVYLSSSFAENPLIDHVIGPIEPWVVIVRYWPEWCGQHVGQMQALSCDHKAVVPLYSLAAGHVAAPVTVIRPLAIEASPFMQSEARFCTMPSPHCTDEALLHLVNQTRALRDQGWLPRWVQLAGRQSIATVDDTYELHFKPVHSPASSLNTIENLSLPETGRATSMVVVLPPPPASASPLRAALLNTETANESNHPGAVALGVFCCVACIGIPCCTFRASRPIAGFELVSRHRPGSEALCSSRLPHEALCSARLPSARQGSARIFTDRTQHSDWSDDGSPSSCASATHTEVTDAVMSPLSQQTMRASC